jgi:hypothetical protein
VLCSEINKLIYSVYNKEELPQMWKESTLLPTYEDGDRTECNSYSRMSLIRIMHILFNIHISRLPPYADKIIREHQY